MRPLPPLHHDPADVRQLTRDILDAPPYVEQAPGPVTRLLRWLADQIGALVQQLFANATVAQVVPWIVALIGVAGLVLLVIWLTRGTHRDRADVEVAGVDASIRVEDLEARARAAEARGDLEAAVRARMAGIVRRLVDAQVILEIPGMTVRDLEHQLQREVPALALRLRPALRRFEDVVYGAATASREDVALLREVATELPTQPATSRSQTTDHLAATSAPDHHR